MVLILDIVSIHKDYILRLPGMLDITTLKIKEMYIFHPYIDIYDIEKNLGIYGQCTYKTLSGRCMFITSNNYINKRYYYCHFHSKYIINPNILTLRLKLYTLTPFPSSLINIVSNYMY